jgi:hypothetical protein
MTATAAADAYHAWLAGWFAQEMTKLAQFYRELGATPFYRLAVAS